MPVELARRWLRGSVEALLAPEIALDLAARGQCPPQRGECGERHATPVGGHVAEGFRDGGRDGCPGGADPDLLLRRREHRHPEREADLATFTDDGSEAVHAARLE